MSVGVIWGGIIAAYVLAGLPIYSMMNNGPKPEGTLPGSVTMQQWERREARSTRFGLIWVAGLVVLLVAWSQLT